MHAVARGSQTHQLAQHVVRAHRRRRRGAAAIAAGVTRADIAAALARAISREVLAVAGLGLLGFYVASIFDVMGLQFVSAGLERLILFTYPTWVVLLSALLLGKALGRKLWFPLALSYSGMLLSFGGEAAAGPGKGLFLGGALILASAVSYALFLVFQGGLMDRVGPQRLTAYAMLSASLAVFAHFALFHPVTTLVQPPTVYGLALVLSVFCSVIPAFLFAYGVKTVGTGPAAILSSVGPVATLFLGWWLLGEPAGFPQVAGMALVMAGGLKLGMGR